MIINLKQNEIEQALRAYVVAQGISLSGKDLSIAFTAGRRESGISAEISIEDADIPGFTDSDNAEAPVAKAAVLTLAAHVAEVVEAPATPIPAEPVGAEPGIVPAPADPVPAEAEPEGESKKTVSLFG